MHFTSLDKWLSWQETLHPSEIELGLERISSVFKRLYPQAVFPMVITVAGTNGKGSSVAMLDAIYREAGYRVGKYTSPHLLKYNERICIDGEPVADKDICNAFERIDNARQDISLTYFEFGTLAALDIFLQVELDIILLEVGLGGRLDAVNIVDADVALITSISKDHTQWLGNNISDIAREKAGIMRKGKPVVSSGNNEVTTLEQEAQIKGATLYQLNKDFTVNKRDDGTWNWQYQQEIRSALPLPALFGNQQVENAAGVLMVIELLSRQLPVNQQAIRTGLMSVKLPGRFQLITGEPVAILDVAHNVDAVKLLTKQLNAYNCSGRILAVLGMLSDKDSKSALSEIENCVDEWFIAPLPTPRSQSTENLNTVLNSINKNVVSHSFDSIKQALAAARQSASKTDCILVFGSFYTVAEALP